MNRFFRSGLILALALTGCAGMDPFPEDAEPDVYDTSIDAYRVDNAARPANIQEALSNKQIIRGMNLDEVRLVLESTPGEGQQTERLWCAAQAVVECPEKCTNCRGLIVARWGSVIYLKGKGTGPLVVDVRHTQTDRANLGAFMARDPHLTYEMARAIQAGQIVPGMTLDEVRLALPGHALDESYQCGKKTGPECAAACPNCTVVFLLQGNTITLDNKREPGVLRVARIASAMGASAGK